MMNQALSDTCPTAVFEMGDTLAYYKLKGEAVELSLLPVSLRERVVKRRQGGALHPQLTVKKLREIENKSVDSFVQVSLRGDVADGGWSTGATMRNSEATQSLKFVSQSVDIRDECMEVTTTLQSKLGFEVQHRLNWESSDLGFRVNTQIKNIGENVIELEMLSSFSLASLSPFASDDAPERLRLHRFRSAWSSEANHSAVYLEDLSLERSWAGGAVSLRYGQTGSLPVRNFHPFIALEDVEFGVFWGAQLAWHGSWQMEVFRRDDSVNLSGGLGDYERAHWMKEIRPGESFSAPQALLSCGVGNLDQFCNRLVELQSRLAHVEPLHEDDLPIVFNEWCSTWGHPTHDYLVKTADRLAQTRCKYLVIDDGWAERPKGFGFQYNGDWNVDLEAFPYGLIATSKAIRARGLIPGLWFEFEPCTSGTDAFEMTDHQLKRHGKVLQVGNRHFWDFRDPWTIEYLSRKVISLLKVNDFGYLKVDYNESIGLGCDGAESLGEGLRQHLEAVKVFFQKIRSELPDLVIENCASGGHRLEPGMVGLTSMSSSTDAHETVDLPIIAANLHRLIPAAKNQVWAVLRDDDSLQRIAYSMAATFLGRMCVSGDLISLSDSQFELMKQAQDFYVKAVPTIRCGQSQILGSHQKSRRQPKGWQAVVREGVNPSEILIVIHCFDLTEDGSGIRIDLPRNKVWHIAETYNWPEGVELKDGYLLLPTFGSFTGCACLLRAVCD